jgi:hypothetical protein
MRDCLFESEGEGSGPEVHQVFGYHSGRVGPRLSGLGPLGNFVNNTELMIMSLS